MATLIKAAGRWLNPDHMIEAEEFPPDGVRAYMLSGHAREFTGRTAAYLAARLDALDPMLVRGPAAGEPIDVTDHVEDVPIGPPAGSGQPKDAGASG